MCEAARRLGAKPKPRLTGGLTPGSPLVVVAVLADLVAWPDNTLTVLSPTTRWVAPTTSRDRDT